MPAVTLEQLLDSRDRRAARQKDLLGKFPGKSLLCLTVQLPGAVKRNALSLAIARAGVAAVRLAFSPDYEELLDLETGYEGFFVLPLSAHASKRQAVTLEDSHPLGRLFDLDVCGLSGPAGQLLPLSREDLGLPPRRCLLCGEPARYCMRAHTHTQEDLIAQIERMVQEYDV